MSTLKVNTLQTAAGVEVYTAKAWVNFNGTGTVAIGASGNVSSITDNGTGDYTVNFTNAMTDANYSWSGMATDTGGFNFNFPSVGARQSGNMTTTTLRIATAYQQSASATDFSVVMVQVFR